MSLLSIKEVQLSIKEVPPNTEFTYDSSFETTIFYCFNGLENSSYITWPLPIKNKYGEKCYYLGKLKYRRYYERYCALTCETILV